MLAALPSELTQANSKRITFDMAVLKLLSPRRDAVPDAGGLGGESAASLRVAHAASVACKIWAYRATYRRLGSDYWLLQACFLAATSVVPSLGTNAVAFDTFVKACQLLRDIGSSHYPRRPIIQRLPLADELLVAIRTLVKASGIDSTHGSIAKTLDGLVGQRRQTVIRNVRLGRITLLGHAELQVDGSQTIAEPTYDVTFSDVITDISNFGGI